MVLTASFSTSLHTSADECPLESSQFRTDAIVLLMEPTLGTVGVPSSDDVAFFLLMAQLVKCMKDNFELSASGLSKVQGLGDGPIGQVYEG